MGTEPIKIFISRAISSDDIHSIFYAHGFALAGRSLVKITPLEINHLPDSHWFFFYSRNGVESLLKSPLKIMVGTRKLAALGEGTAEALRTERFEPLFAGNGIPEDVASRFLEVRKKNELVTFVRAKNSRNSIAKLMPADVSWNELIAYDNTIVDDASISEHQYAILTSSLNAKGYARFASKYSPVICIGQPTAETASALGLEVIGVSPKPDANTLHNFAIQTISLHSGKNK